MNIKTREDEDLNLLSKTIRDFIETITLKIKGKHLPLKEKKSEQGISIGIVGYGKLADRTLSYILQSSSIEIGEPINEIYVLTTDEKYSDLEKKEKEILSKNKIKIKPILYKDDSLPNKRDFSKIKHLFETDIILITSGNDPKNAVRREECINANLPLINEIGSNLKGYNGLVIVTTNPVDIMTYALASSSQLPYDQIVGLTQTDTNRFKYYLAKLLNKNMDEIIAFVIGAHNETMVPLLSNVKIREAKLQEILENSKFFDDVKDLTRDYGLTFKKEGKTPVESPAKSLVDTIIAAVKGLSVEENEVVTTSKYDEKEGIFIGNITLFCSDLTNENLKNFRVCYEKEYDLNLSDEEIKNFERSKNSIKQTLDDLIKKGYFEAKIKGIDKQKYTKELEKKEFENNELREIIEIRDYRKHYYENEKFPYNLDIILCFSEHASRTNTKSMETINFDEIRGARSVNLIAENKKLVFGCKKTIRVYDIDDFKEILEIHFKMEMREDSDSYSRENIEKFVKFGFNSVDLAFINNKIVVYATRSDSGTLQAELNIENTINNQQTPRRYEVIPKKVLQKFTNNANYVGPLVFKNLKNEKNPQLIGKLYVAVDRKILEFYANNKNEGIELVLNYEYYSPDSLRVRKFKVENDFLIVQDQDHRIAIYDTKSKEKNYYSYLNNIHCFDAINYDSKIILALKKENEISLLSFDNQKSFRELSNLEFNDHALLLQFSKYNKNVVLFALSNSKLSSYELHQDFINEPNKSKILINYFNLPILIPIRLFTDALIISKDS